MTIQEFTDRTGLMPTEMEFQHIHDIYMQTNLNKDVFCKEFKKHGKSEIIEELWCKLDCKIRAFDELFTRHDNFKNEQYKKDLELALFLLGKAAAYDDPELESRAIQLTSRNTCVLIKIKSGYPLNEDDLTYITEHLH